jgi:hypothetical protein
MIKRKSFNVQILSIFLFASLAAVLRVVTPWACQSCARAPISVPNLAGDWRGFNLAVARHCKLPGYEAQLASGGPHASLPCLDRCAAMPHLHARLQRRTAGEGRASASACLAYSLLWQGQPLVTDRVWRQQGFRVPFTFSHVNL